MLEQYYCAGYNKKLRIIKFLLLYFCICSTLPRKKSAFTLSFSQESTAHFRNKRIMLDEMTK